MTTFVDRLVNEMREKQSVLCVGLDPQVRYIPESILKQGYEEAESDDGREGAARAISTFNQKIIKAVKPYVTVVKPQMAFYEAYGYWGVWAFEKTVKFAKKQGLLVLEDAKRCDGGDTAQAYAEGHLGKVGVWDNYSEKARVLHTLPSFDVDAMTVIPYIGTSCVSPFVDTVKEYDKGIFIVDKTSFTPNSEIEQLQTISGLKVWQETALLVKKWSQGCEGGYGNNIGVVMGATYPEDAPKMREILPDCFFLVPGYSLPEGLGQGGDADGAIKGVREDGYGVIVNMSRGAIYAYRKGPFKCDPLDFVEATAKAAEFARNDLNAALKRAGKIPW